MVVVAVVVYPRPKSTDPAAAAAVAAATGAAPLKPTTPAPAKARRRRYQARPTYRSKASGIEPSTSLFRPAAAAAAPSLPPSGRVMVTERKSGTGAACKGGQGGPGAAGIRWSKTTGQGREPVGEDHAVLDRRGQLLLLLRKITHLLLQKVSHMKAE